jgi:hypothetical protein
MIGKIRIWFSRHGHKLTWFIIGWLVTSGMRDFAMGNFVGATLSLAVAYLNYILDPA